MHVVLCSSELDQLTDAFSSVMSISVSLVSSSSVEIVFTVPSDSTGGGDAGDYANLIRVQFLFGLHKLKQAHRHHRVSLRELKVSSSNLEEADCGILSDTYLKLMHETAGDDDDQFSDTFKVAPLEQEEEEEEDGYELSSKDTFFALAVQLVTDATDASLPDTLAAQHLGASSSKHSTPLQSNRTTTTTSRLQSNSTGGVDENVSSVPIPPGFSHDDSGDCGVRKQNSSSLVSSAASPTTMMLNLKVRMAKVDHMNNEQMYIKSLVSFAKSYTDLLVLLVQDPISARVLLGLVAVIPDEKQNSCLPSGPRTPTDVSASAANSPTGPSSFPSSSSSPCLVQQPDEAASFLKDIRMSTVDVDSHGRKCRERCMRDLGCWEARVPHVVFSESIAGLWKNQQKAAAAAGGADGCATSFSPSVLKLFPGTREEAVSTIKRFLVEPLMATAQHGGNGSKRVTTPHQKASASCNQHQHSNFSVAPPGTAPSWLNDAFEILHDKKLFDHV